MKRLDKRVEAAIERAAKRYGATTTIVGSDGAKLAIFAIKETFEADDYDAIGTETRVRKAVFTVAKTTFDKICELFTEGVQYSTAEVLPLFRKAKIIERRGSQKITYQLNGITPFFESSLGGSTVRLFAYESK